MQGPEDDRRRDGKRGGGRKTVGFLLRSEVLVPPVEKLRGDQGSSEQQQGLHMALKSTSYPAHPLKWGTPKVAHRMR